MKRSLGLKICEKMEIKIAETYHVASHLMLRDTYSEPWLPLPWLDILCVRSREVRLFTQPGGCEWGQPTSDKGLENITDYGQNKEENYRLATKKVSGIYRQPTKVENCNGQPTCGPPIQTLNLEPSRHQESIKRGPLGVHGSGIHVLYLKGLSKYRREDFHFKDIDVFLLCKLDQ